MCLLPLAGSCKAVYWSEMRFGWHSCVSCLRFPSNAAEIALRLFLPKNIWVKMLFKECWSLSTKSCRELQHPKFPLCWKGGGSSQTNSCCVREALMLTPNGIFRNFCGAASQPCAGILWGWGMMIDVSWAQNILFPGSQAAALCGGAGVGY